MADPKGSNGDQSYRYPPPEPDSSQSRPIVHPVVLDPNARPSLATLSSLSLGNPQYQESHIDTGDPHQRLVSHTTTQTGHQRSHPAPESAALPSGRTRPSIITSPIPSPRQSGYDADRRSSILQTPLELRNYPNPSSRDAGGTSPSPESTVARLSPVHDTSPEYNYPNPQAPSSAMTDTTSATYLGETAYHLPLSDRPARVQSGIPSAISPIQYPSHYTPKEGPQSPQDTLRSPTERDHFFQTKLDSSGNSVSPSSGNLRPSYQPDASVGPNGPAPGLHQPGQIAHPNMKTENRRWLHSLCECTDLETCCVGLWCPCILYGKVQYRLNQKGAKRDATDLLGYSAFNGSCMVMAIACGVNCLLSCFQRTRIRKIYHIQGSVGDDCAMAFCCYSCSLIQAEREVRDREDDKRRFAGPAAGVGGPTTYMRPDDMTYQSP